MHLHVASSHWIWERLQLLSHVLQLLLEPQPMIQALDLYSCVFNLFHIFLVHFLQLQVLLQPSSFLLINLVLSQLFDMFLCEENSKVALDEF